VAVALIAAVGVWQLITQQRRHRLRERFGPEYERTVRKTDSRRKAETELAGREEHRSQFQTRPLSSTATVRYREEWQAVQAEFVDAPSTAVESADHLIQSVMVERGYPVEDFEQRAADVSVDHPNVVENYRQGHRLARQNAAEQASTEDLRQAMKHYRALFDELLT